MVFLPPAGLRKKALQSITQPLLERPRPTVVLVALIDGCGRTID